jgi:Fe-S cluster biogenesis protein NfuA
VTNDREFQDRVRQLGKLVTEFDQLPEGSAKVAGKVLVQLLMDIHGAGLDRIMEIISESESSATEIIGRMGSDSMVGSLLLLYSLHPDSLQARVHNAIERLRPRLRKLACTIEQVHLNDGDVKVRLATSGHTCGSSTGDLRSLVEDGIFEYAPDVTSVEISGLEEPAASGFVSIETLLGHGLSAVPSNVPSPAPDDALNSAPIFAESVDYA